MAEKTQSELWDEFCAKEKQLTKEASEDVRQYLSHDTSTTRKRLAAVLRERADVIESEAESDRLMREMLASAEPEPLSDIPDESPDKPLPGEDTGPKSLADDAFNT